MFFNFYLIISVIGLILQEKSIKQTPKKICLKSYILWILVCIFFGYCNIYAVDRTPAPKPKPQPFGPKNLA
jgi:hypothetical protein